MKRIILYLISIISVLLNFLNTSYANDVSLLLLQDIETHRAIDIEFFSINNDKYLIVVNTDYGSTETNANLYKWNLHSFIKIDEIDGDHFCEFFTIGDESYIIIGCKKDNNQEGSQIYKWTGVKFEPIQFIETPIPGDYNIFTIEEKTYLAIIIDDPWPIFLWNGSNFIEKDNLKNHVAPNVESFSLDGETYLAVANMTDANSIIYKWEENSFKEFQNNIVNYAYDLEFFHFNEQTFLVVGHNTSMLTIYKWNGVIFENYKSVSTSPSRINDLETFRISNTLYLGVAKWRDDTTYRVNSYVYRWNGESFDNVLSIDTVGAYKIISFSIDNYTYLAVDSAYDDSKPGAQGYYSISKIYYFFDCSKAIGSITKPNNFIYGTPAKASEVNENFDILYNSINQMSCQMERLQAEVNLLKSIVCKDSAECNVFK